MANVCATSKCHIRLLTCGTTGTTVPVVQWNVEILTGQMADRNWSGRQLALRAGVSPSHVTRILNGDRGGRPRWETVLRLAGALDVEPTTLIVGTVELPPEPPPPPPKPPRKPRVWKPRKRKPPEPAPDPWAVNEWETDGTEEGE